MGILSKISCSLALISTTGLTALITDQGKQVLIFDIICETSASLQSQRVVITIDGLGFLLSQAYLRLCGTRFMPVQGWHSPVCSTICSAPKPNFNTHMFSTNLETVIYRGALCLESLITSFKGSMRPGANAC